MGEDTRTYVEYLGIAGATYPCVHAVERILQSRRGLRRCLILTCEGESNAQHALLLTDEDEDTAVVKSGFTSGYGGTGPKEFSSILALMQWHDVELDEVEVTADIIDRLEASALTIADMDRIDRAQRIRPTRLWSYVLEDHYLPSDRGNPWRDRDLVVPYGLLDDRLAAAARDFWTDTDKVLLRAHRALEEAVRDKAGIVGDDATSGPARIYAAAFNRDGALFWPGVSESERAGRANLFVGTVSAYRNPRAHRTVKNTPAEALSELLLLNHLFRLEATSERRS